MLLAGNGENDGQQCVFLTEDGNGMIQTNTNQEGMIALDDFGNSVSQLMPQQVRKVKTYLFNLKCVNNFDNINVILMAKYLFLKYTQCKLFMDGRK